MQDSPGCSLKQTTGLVNTLKAQLKGQSKTYSSLAQYLNLSEASVKRLFSEKSFSISRLEQICDYLGLDFFELISLSVQAQVRMQALTYEQESKIASDTALLLVTLSVINGFSYESLLAQYTFDRHALIQMLAYLDSIKLIELLPSNKIRLRVAPNFRWLPNGPIQHYFLKKAQQSFFDSAFAQDTEKLLVLNGVLSEASNQRLQALMESLSQDFNAVMREDKKVPMTQKFGNTMVLALRQWQYPAFEPYIKLRP